MNLSPGILEEHLDRVRTKWPSTEATPLPNGGGHLVTIRDFPLPKGWNKSSTTVWFIVPSGYPTVYPEHFWSDIDLRLASGAPCQLSREGSVPGLDGHRLWHMVYLRAWSPNRDSLFNWVHVIRMRLSHIR